MIGGAGHRTLAQRVAAGVLRLFGWSTVFLPPPGPKAVVIFYPHTSNWDFVLGMLCRAATGFPVRWAGKHTLFRQPFGALLRHLGGFPVDRRMRTGLVAQLCEEFDRSQQLYLAITPEGTRSRTDCWKSYHLARQAGVPLGLAFIDHRRREIGIGAYVELSGNANDDLLLLRNYYAEKRGKHPAKHGKIRFKSSLQ